MLKIILYSAVILLSIGLLAALSLWILGLRQPSRAVMKHDTVILLSLKQTAPAPGAIALFQDEELIWSSRTIFPLIGAQSAYWTDFVILRGDADQLSKRLKGADFDDVSAVRLRITKIPAIALGIMRASYLLGGGRRPEEALITSVEEFGARTDILPSDEAIAALKSAPDTQQLTMLNFLEYFSDTDGNKTPYRDRYNAYGLQAMKAVHRVGGQFLFAGRVSEVLIEPSAGPTPGPWDDMAAMIYPDPTAILYMEQYAFYQKALEDRDAGLARTVVIATAAGSSIARAPRP